MPQSKRQEHLTPDRVFELIFEKWQLPESCFFDPVPKGTPFKSPCFFNGLYAIWKKYNYVNPPFEKEILEKFVMKALREAKKGKTTIMLLPSKTDQAWFHDILLFYEFEIMWIRKRLKFKNNKHHATDTHFLVNLNLNKQYFKNYQ